MFTITCSLCNEQFETESSRTECCPECKVEEERDEFYRAECGPAIWVQIPPTK